MLSNYPPGVSSIPGDYDYTISFTITFEYDAELIDDETVDDIEEIVKDFLDVPVDVDMSTLVLNDNGQFTVDVSYSDDICADVRHMGTYDIDALILEYVNDEVFKRCGVILDHHDSSIEYDVHR